MAFSATTQTAYHEALEKLEFSVALEKIFDYVRRMNKYIDQTEPWKLIKDENKAADLDAVLAHLAYALYQIAILLKPFLIDAPRVIFEQLGVENTTEMFAAVNDTTVLNLSSVNQGDVLYARVDAEAATAYIVEQMHGGKKPTYTELAAEELITIDDFGKVQIRIGEILEVAKHPNADRLLVFTLDFGEYGPKQIVSGIAKSYPETESLIGKKVLAVFNLQPVTLRGVDSNGMLLTNEIDKKARLIFVDETANNGDLLR